MIGQDSPLCLSIIPYEFRTRKATQICYLLEQQLTETKKGREHGRREAELRPGDYFEEEKSNEEWALRKKEQFEQKKLLHKKSKDYIKKPEDFILEYRSRELDLVKMKQRVKRKRSALVTPKSKLLIIIRIQGKNDMHPRTRKVLYSLRLRRIFSAVFVKATERIMEKLQRVEPYVTYGHPNLKSIKELVYQKGHAKIDDREVPLTDNNLIEQELGKYGIVCLEDMVHEIANVGAHFKEVTNFLWPFALRKPEGGLQGSKILYKDDGDTGDRKDLINELINKMN